MESLTDISEYQEVIDLSSTKYEEKNRVQCMIVEEKFSEIQVKNFLMIKYIMLNRLHEAKHSN